MKLPNWFKIIWWIVLLGILSYAMYVRFPDFKMGKVTAMDPLVLLLWVALALVPIFREIELPGVKLKQEPESLQPQLQALEKDNNEVAELSPSKAKEVLKAFDSPLLVEVEKILKEGMKTINPSSVEQKDDILYKALASNQIALTFERNYLLIFGSQIRALQYLNQRPTATVNSNELRPFYDQAKTENPKFYETYSFTNWLNFLHSTVLIIFQGESVGITIRGKEFLKYLLDQRYSFNKGG